MSHIHEKIDFTVEVFIVYKNKVLLRMHDKHHRWLSVGGHIELDEDPIQAAMRDKGLANPSASLRAVVRREYRRMPKVSIDYAVLEKAGAAGRLLALEGRFGWSDVGSWAAAHRMLPHDGKGNAGLGKWLAFKSKDCLVYSRDRLVALLGVQGLVVVDTADALLVAAMERSQEVRELVEELKRRGYGRYTAR